MRLSSLRQLQAISHQLNLATKGRVLDLDFFQPPEGLILRRIQPDERRVCFVSSNGHRLQRGFEKKQQFLMVADDSEEPQVPEPQVQMCLPGQANWWATVPMLVLQMDQGSPGCAGSA